MTVPVRRLPEDAAAALTAVDLVVGVVAVTAAAATATARTLRVDGLIARGARPFLRAGAAARTRIVREVDTYAPGLVTLAVGRYVDLDGLVATVDLDAVAAKLDVDAVIDRVDLNEVATRLDVEAVIDRVDLNEVAKRIDIELILDRLDLTSTVTSRVDLKTIVDSVLAQMDLAGLVEEVMDEIDLPEIIRGSTGTMASDTVQVVRMQGVNADEAVARIVDRVLLRRNRARPAPGGAG
ncbi:hypothetical protein [Nocardioides sp.]|uniref:hypothetical protein n=1 Tax=Nocardioides sp. TaxID=35761 RepID=UPI003783DF37